MLWAQRRRHGCDCGHVGASMLRVVNDDQVCRAPIAQTLRLDRRSCLRKRNVLYFGPTGPQYAIRIRPSSRERATIAPCGSAPSRPAPLSQGKGDELGANVAFANGSLVHVDQLPQLDSTDQSHGSPVLIVAGVGCGYGCFVSAGHGREPAIELTDWLRATRCLAAMATLAWAATRSNRRAYRR